MSELPHELSDQLIARLVELIDSLREETRAFLDQPGDQQLWYNRGYANGMLATLQQLGQAHRLGNRSLDDPEDVGGQLAMPWGKAYRHGEAMGGRETHEITGTHAI